MGDSTAPGRSVSKPTAAYWPYLRRLCAFYNACAQQVRHVARKSNLDVAGRTSQLSYTAASCLICVTRVALPEKPGKVSFVCIVGRAVLYCDGCGLAVRPYITGHSKTVLYGEYSPGGAFESPTQSTISPCNHNCLHNEYDNKKTYDRRTQEDFVQSGCWVMVTLPETLVGTSTLVAGV